MKELSRKQSVILLFLTALVMVIFCILSYVYVNKNTMNNPSKQYIFKNQSDLYNKKEKLENEMAQMVKEELDRIQKKIGNQNEASQSLYSNKREGSNINNPEQIQTVKEYEQIKQADMVSLYEMLEEPIEDKTIVLYFSPLDINFKDKNYNIIKNSVLSGWHLPDNINQDIASLLISQEKPKITKRKVSKPSVKKKTKSFKNPDDMSVQEKEIYNLVLYIAHAYDLNFDLAQQITEQSYILGDKYQMQPVFLLSFISMQIRFYEDYKKQYYSRKENIERDVKALHQLIEKHGYQKDMTPVIMDFNTMYEDTARKFNKKIKEAYKNMSQVVRATNISARK